MVEGSQRSLLALPDELIIGIAETLDHNGLLSLGFTCSRLYGISFPLLMRSPTVRGHQKIVELTNLLKRRQNYALALRGISMECNEHAEYYVPGQKKVLMCLAKILTLIPNLEDLYYRSSVRIFPIRPLMEFLEMMTSLRSCELVLTGEKTSKIYVDVAFIRFYSGPNLRELILRGIDLDFDPPDRNAPDFSPNNEVSPLDRLVFESCNSTRWARPTLLMIRASRTVEIYFGKRFPSSNFGGVFTGTSFHFEHVLGAQHLVEHFRVVHAYTDTFTAEMYDEFWRTNSQRNVPPLVLRSSSLRRLETMSELLLPGLPNQLSKSEIAEHVAERLPRTLRSLVLQDYIVDGLSNNRELDADAFKHHLHRFAPWLDEIVVVESLPWSSAYSSNVSTNSETE